LADGQPDFGVDQAAQTEFAFGQVTMDTRAVGCAHSTPGNALDIGLMDMGRHSGNSVEDGVDVSADFLPRTRPLLRDGQNRTLADAARSSLPSGAACGELPDNSDGPARNDFAAISTMQAGGAE
jgi:hypothetical protein